MIAIHDRVLEWTGQRPSPLLHPDKLESAINRPRHSAHYEGADIIAQAVRLAVGISQSQAFQDGNKRTALLATDMFLASNGFSLEDDSARFACWLICVAGRISDEDLDVCVEHLGLDLVAELDAMNRERVIARFEVWLRLNVTPIDPADLDDPE